MTRDQIRQRIDLILEQWMGGVHSLHSAREAILALVRAEVVKVVEGSRHLGVEQNGIMQYGNQRANEKLDETCAALRELLGMKP